MGRLVKSAEVDKEYDYRFETFWQEPVTSATPGDGSNSEYINDLLENGWEVVSVHDSGGCDDWKCFIWLILLRKVKLSKPLEQQMSLWKRVINYFDLYSEIRG